MADKVVVNADFAHAMTTLVPMKRKSGRKEAPKERLFMLYIQALPWS